jgi:serine phosphatase RsbU (regulator of sigma subunit)
MERAHNAELLAMVAHRECVQANDALENVHKRFAKHNFEYMAVLDGEQLVGLCARRQVGMMLGARYGFALYANKPVSQALVPSTTAVTVGSQISEVLKTVFSRPDETFFDDVVLLDEEGKFQGLIFARTLVRLQHRLLLENIGRLEIQQREITEKNTQMEEDLQMAREIQQALLPQQYPRIPANVTGSEGWLRFSHCYQPAGAVSGDFFHVQSISDTAAGVFICDVMGHGVRSAFITAMLRALVEELRSLGNDPGVLLTRMNCELRSILKQTGGPMFATAFYLMADVNTGEIRYAKAGHPNPLHLRRSADLLEALSCAAGTQGPPLGLFDESRYGTNTGSLAAGDMILFYTDGVHEVFDREEHEFGDRGLQAAIMKRRGLPLDNLLSGVVSDARDFAGNSHFSDDVCLVGMEWVQTEDQISTRDLRTEAIPAS